MVFVFLVHANTTLRLAGYALSERLLVTVSAVFLALVWSAIHFLIVQLELVTLHHVPRIYVTMELLHNTRSVDQEMLDGVQVVFVKI